MIKGFTNASVKGTKQAEGFVKYSSDYTNPFRYSSGEADSNVRYFNLRISSRVGVPSGPRVSITSSLAREKISGC